MNLGSKHVLELSSNSRLCRKYIDTMWFKFTYGKKDTHNQTVFHFSPSFRFKTVLSELFFQYLYLMNCSVVTTEMNIKGFSPGYLQCFCVTEGKEGENFIKELASSVK